MTPGGAKELRKPFARESIGKLPKGGVMLDFVGHAVVTSRLLEIDPEWTWEPMGTDDQGLPATDRNGNLWIRLTILGTTRIGVGDGKSAKEAIGDAIRNAAMRFGVALDLWSKEELEHGEPEPAPVVESLNTLKTQVWEASRRIDFKLNDDERKAWIKGELTAQGGTEEEALRGLLREWAA